MKVQIDKFTRSNITEKRARLANLSDFRASHEALKAKWVAEHNIRHDILHSAIKKVFSLFYPSTEKVIWCADSKTSFPLGKQWARDGVRSHST